MTDSPAISTETFAWGVIIAPLLVIFASLTALFWSKGVISLESAVIFYLYYISITLMIILLVMVDFIRAIISTGEW